MVSLAGREAHFSFLGILVSVGDVDAAALLPIPARFLFPRAETVRKSSAASSL